MKKIIFVIFFFFFFPVLAFAQESLTSSKEAIFDNSRVNQDIIFHARVKELIDERDYTDQETGKSIKQQQILLEGLNKGLEGKTVFYDGFQDYQLLGISHYAPGQELVLTESQDIDGNKNYRIVDFVRLSGVYWLCAILILLVFVVVRWKGLRSLLSVALSMLFILKILIPALLLGYSPMAVAVPGAIFLVLLTVYLTYGWNNHAHITVLTMSCISVVVWFLSSFFSEYMHLTGYITEEIGFLSNYVQQDINTQGLLLAGLMISMIGILDDAIVSQVSLVSELKNANSSLSFSELYKRAMRVGVDHIGSIVNTIFLVFAGASLPLLMLFSVQTQPELSFLDVVNSEIIATEIMRSLVGSIGLILSVPLATFFAIRFSNHSLSHHHGKHH